MSGDEREKEGVFATEQIVAPSLLTVPSPGLVLRVVAGPDTGASSVLDQDRASVGTHPSNALALTDRAVSKFHFEIGMTSLGVRVTDCGSTNGTFVGTCRVKEAHVPAGTTIRAGLSAIEVANAEGDVDVAVFPDVRFGSLVGMSTAMRRLFAAIAKVAPHDVPVLIQGETGTGKEVVAREIHARSPRHKGPFVVVDCGAIPPELAESEILGHIKGAFTGALASRRGAFEEANGGTLFLDEIGELDLNLQPRLLRAVEAKQVKPVGSDSYRAVDVRVIAATHRDLREAVNRGAFREDLYYRLAVATIWLPAIRERPEDIPLLVHHFIEDSARTLGLPAPDTALPPDTIAALQSLPWRGNCRELRNHVERSLVMSGEIEVAPDAPHGTRAARTATASPTAARATPPSPFQVRADLPFKDAKVACVDQFEAAYLTQRIRDAKGNVSRAAREMVIDRAYLIRLLRKHGIR